MDNAKTLSDLFLQFHERLQDIKNLVSLKESKEEDWYEMTMPDIFNQLATFEVTFSAIKCHLKDFKDALENTNDLKKNLEETIEVAKYMNQNIPDHLSTRHKSTNKRNIESSSVPETNFVNSINDKNTEKTVNPPPVDIPEKIVDVTNPLEKEVKYIEFLTVSEFESIPKYMKGRITYKQLNSFIEELTKCFEAKYRLMSLSKRAVPEKKKNIYAKYKAQENAEAEGMCFIVIDDLKEYSKLRNEPATRAILVMLRHVGRIREIRGGGLVRYAATFY